jgi:hypothetical protein
MTLGRYCGRRQHNQNKPEIRMKTKNRVLALAIGFVTTSSFAQGGAGNAKKYDCSHNKCDVNITIAAGKIGVDRDPLVVKVKNSRIVWHLPAGYVFCPELNDGIHFKSANDQFDENWGTDDHAGARPGDMKGCKKKYHWRDKASKKGSHAYSIVFHDAKGVRYEWDPTIINDTP